MFKTEQVPKPKNVMPTAIARLEPRDIHLITQFCPPLSPLFLSLILRFIQVISGADFEVHAVGDVLRGGIGASLFLHDGFIASFSSSYGLLPALWTLQPCHHAVDSAFITSEDLGQ